MTIDETPWPMNVVLFVFAIALFIEVTSFVCHPGKTERRRYWLSTMVRATLPVVRVCLPIIVIFLAVEQEWSTLLPMALVAVVNETVLWFVRVKTDFPPLGDDLWTRLANKRERVQ